jgi:transcriptional regulator with XRE-family HTH domain
MVTVGEAVRVARVTKSISQEELAQLCGRTQTWVSHIETGLRLPTVEGLKKVAWALGLSAADLWNGSLDDEAAAPSLVAAMTRIAVAVERIADALERPRP